MSSIRVLQIIPTLVSGGAERMVVNLMTHLDAERFEAAVICLAAPEGSPQEQLLAQRRYRVWYLGKGPGFDPRMLGRIRSVVNEFRPQIVHSHLSFHYVFTALPRSRAPRHVATIHLSAQTTHKRFMLRLGQMAFRHGVVAVAVSREVAEWAGHAYGVQNCTVIPNGIPIEDYQRASGCRQAWRTKEGFREDDVLFVSVARLEEQKNHRMLVEAFARRIGTEPRAHLVLVGEGSCRLSLERQSCELGLRDKVLFLGQRADISECLSAADVFVLASHNEGNPLCVMEAMAAGLPVVATAVGGVPELIVGQKSGLLVNPGDCDAFAAAMLMLFQDETMRRRIASSATQRALESFSASLMARAYGRLYERILIDETRPLDTKNGPSQYAATLGESRR